MAGYDRVPTVAPPPHERNSGLSLIVTHAGRARLLSRLEAPVLQRHRGTDPFPIWGLLPLLSAATLAALVLAAPPVAGDPRSDVASGQTGQETPPPAPTRKPRTAEQMVGGKCLQCHRKVVEEYVNEAHGKSAHFMVGGSEATCETCHGPGEAHVDSTLKADILNPPSQ